jgi:hypothetical protein
MNNNKSKSKQSKQPARRVIEVSKFLQDLGLPVPRLPFLVGSAGNLGPRASVYPRCSFSIPIEPQSAVIATGALATSIPLLVSTLIGQFSGGFANVFDEYCLVGARIELRMNDVSNPQGLCIVYYDESSSATPTGGTSVAFPHLELLVSDTESPSKHVIDWKPMAYNDMNWTSTGSPAATVWLKLFASTSVTYTGATTGGQVMITGALQVAFRGFN